ncbi:MAG: LAGLIDADG family homing endonuclease [Candidatus Heimdallarchaeota archaeon]
MSVLNWLNDTLLFDVEPQLVNLWVNANELIQLDRRNDIFLSEGQLNLYPIMVRKSDFVRKNSSDRIMARFPLRVIDEQTQEWIHDKILLLSELTRDYFYKSINKSIMDWKKVILNYLEKGAIPYPIYRCCFELGHTKSTYCNTKSLLHFTSARGEGFKMPIELSKELAYLAGMVNGDGNLSKYILRVVDYSLQNIKQLQGMFRKYFDQIGNILTKRENSPEVVITNLWVVRLFSFLTDQPIGGKKYHALREPLIFQDNPIFRSYYWSGVMDSDGSYKNKSVVFTSASLNYVEDFKSYLLENNIESKLTERDDKTVTLYIPAKFHIQLHELLISLHPEKKLEFDILKLIPFRTAKYFTQFNKSSQINGYFNFRLIENLSITGLGEIIRKIRGKQARRTFSNKLSISEETIQLIEKNKMSINILLLDQILNQVNLKLMPFLSKQKSSLYHIRNSKRIKLTTQPNPTLKSLLSSFKFHKKHVIILDDKMETIQEIEDYFQIVIHDNKIRSKLLIRFLSTFCETDFKDDRLIIWKKIKRKQTFAQVIYKRGFFSSFRG